ncbi:MAG: hypothetical protein U1F53_23520 [Burkholderiaceae bacterium]
MKLQVSLVAAACAAGLWLASAPARAQDVSYTPGSVWQLSSIQVEPGQFEKYMDYLAANWKRVQELGKKEGIVVSYHVLSVNSNRKDEPDLVLAVEFKDYQTNAQRLAFQKKLEAMLAQDVRKQDVASGERQVMRKLVGNMELQELVLK